MSLEDTVEQLQRELTELKANQQANDAQNEENLNSVKEFRNSKIGNFLKYLYFSFFWC